MHSRRKTVVNLLGTLGYISIIFQWLWMIVTLGHPLLSSDLSYLIPVHDTQVEVVAVSQPSVFIIGIVITLTIMIFMLTLYVLWKLPRAIGKQGGSVTKHAVHALIPIITHRQIPAEKERRRLSRQLILLIKALLVVLPCLALVWARPIGELSTEVIWVVGIFCASCSLAYFGLQQILIIVLKVSPEESW
ncbi:MAG: hypothetical protein ABIP74_03000 [Candidatus Saccharimonas sp.]